MVRQAEPEDLAALSKLARETFPRSVRSVVQRFARPDAPTVLVALDESTIVGYVQLSNVTIRVESATDKDQQLSALYVGSEHQGKGIGKLLMNAALDHPRFREASNIYLDVWEENIKAFDCTKATDSR